MKKRLAMLIAAAFTATALLVRGAELSPKGKKVVDYLLNDWAERMHSTSVPLAMENLGLEPDDALRIEIVEHFRKNTDLATNLKWWGPNNYLLSHEEKLMAKHLINTFDREERLPTLSDLSETLGTPQQRAGSRLAFLGQAGLLQETAGEPLGYSLAPRYARWGGPLRYNFHAVTIGRGKPFEVW